MYRLAYVLILLSGCVISACGDRRSMQAQPAQPVHSLASISTSLMPRGSVQPNTEIYQHHHLNPVQRVSDQPISTFSSDVDTGSYSNTRRFLNDRRLPPVDAVRLEEMINYFDYHYPQPQPNAEHPFTVTTETVDSPWKDGARLIKIAIQAEEIQPQDFAAANLVFLVDVSGSMQSADKLPLLKQSLGILTEQLRAQDRISIISYANHEKLLLAPTSGAKKAKIHAVINGLQAAGATAGEQALQMAYQQASKAYIPDGINRIILATDGDFNLGLTDFNSLKGMVAEKRKTGISLTTLGFGRGNINERLMEQLADAGDGNYSYIDNQNEAKKVLQRQLSSTLATVAQDLKIQVEFNPATVKEYRLLGYENRQLQHEDFNNDQVDAGDVGAGHQLTAIYEIIPVGQQGWLSDSRYQTQPPSGKATNNQEYAYINLRYKRPNSPQSRLYSQAVKAQTIPLAEASSDTQFAIAVAAYAQQLQGGQYNAAMGWKEIIQLAQQADQPDPYQLREEFIGLAKIASSLSSSPPQLR